MFWQHQYRVGHVPVLQQYLAIFDMATVLPLVAPWSRTLSGFKDMGKHSPISLPLSIMHRLAGRLFTTSRPFYVAAVVGVLVYRSLHICVHDPWYCRRSQVCSKVSTHLGADCCAGLLLVHAGLLLHVPLHGVQDRQKTSCRLLVFLCRTNPHGLLVHHLMFFFPLSIILQGHLYCCSESTSSSCPEQVASRGSVSESLKEADYFPLLTHRPCCGGWAKLASDKWNEMNRALGHLCAHIG